MMVAEAVRKIDATEQRALLWILTVSLLSSDQSSSRKGDDKLSLAHSQFSFQLALMACKLTYAAYRVAKMFQGENSG